LSFTVEYNYVGATVLHVKDAIPAFVAKQAPKSGRGWDACSTGPCSALAHRGRRHRCRRATPRDSCHEEWAL